MQLISHADLLSCDLAEFTYSTSFSKNRFLEICQVDHHATYKQERLPSSFPVSIPVIPLLRY